MTYLIAEMVFSLLAAAVLGLALGWLLRTLGTKAKFNASEQLWSRRLRVADDEVAARTRELESVQAALDEKSELLTATIRNEQSLIENLGGLERQVGLLKEEVEVKESSVRELTAEIGGLQSAMQRASEEVDAGRSALASAGVDLERALDRIRELERGLAESNAREGVLEDAVQATRRTAEQLERSLADMRSEVADVMEQLDHKDRELSQLTANLSKRSAEFESVSSQSHSTDEMLALLEDRLSNRDEDLAVVRSELAEAEATIGNLEASNQHLRGVVADLEAKAAKGSQPMSAEDRTEVSSLRAQLAASGETIERLNREVRSLEARSLSLEGEIQQRRTSGKRLDDELAAARKRQAASDARIVTLHERIADLERTPARITVDGTSSTDGAQALS